MRSFNYDKLSEIKWDSEILSLVAKIHEYKGHQDLYIKGKPVELERLVEIAKVQSTQSSNKIEGIVTTNTRIKQLVEEKTTPKNRDEKEILGYRDVLNTIHESHDFIPIKPQYILQLHRDLFKYSEVSYGGHFKNVQNYISETRADGTSFIRFTPIAPYETEAAIQAICESYYRTRHMETVDALILIPTFICDFLCIHPFNDGNGRMSRLLTLLLLYQNGYVVGKYVSLEKQIEKTKDIYYDALQTSDIGWHEETNNPIPFIKYMLRILLACYKEFEARVGMMKTKEVKSSAYDAIKQYAQDKLGKFTSSEAIAFCPSFSRSSILNAIKKLVDEGFLIKIGSGRNTCYVKHESQI